VFERFTKLARQSLVAAQTSAQQFGDPRIGSEHLLLGLVLVEGVAARVLGVAGVDDGVVRDGIVRRRSAAIDDAAALRTIGIDVAEVKASVEATFGEGALDRPRGRDRSRGAPPFAPEAKKALELALREALTLEHGYIGTEHLLLALLRLGEGSAFEILADHLGDPEELRPKVMEALRRAS
jgi:ATP-dependent Clp protease ATP-binding subunit ClpA